MDNACGFSLVEPPVSPRSPPASADLYGKRRQLVKVQSLEREITLLREELKTIEDLQPASGCCKELDDFIGAKPDPFVAINQGSHKFSPFWKRLWGCFCCNLPCFCCSSHCLHHPQKRHCCMCYVSFDEQCPSCICSGKITCHDCGKCTGLSCLQNTCCCFKPVAPNCKVNLCSNFGKNCPNTCCL